MKFDDHDVARLARCLNGVPVLGCAWGSETARVGLCRGDVVVAVNGVRTPDEMAFGYARSLRNDYIELEIVREGETLQFLIGWERAKNFDPTRLLDEVVASRVAGVANPPIRLA